MSHMVAQILDDQNGAGQLAYWAPGRQASTSGERRAKGTASKAKPREGATRAWLEALRDLLDAHDLGHILEAMKPPTYSSFAEQAPGADPSDLAAVHAMALSEWKTMNTDVFWIVKNSIDLSGPMMDTDLDYIRTSFVHGEERNGAGLYAWVLGFIDESSVSAQARLITKLEDMKLAAGAPSLTSLEVHAHSMLALWAKIEGNSVHRPAAYYHRLLRSMAGAPEGSKLSHLHHWLAGKVADGDPIICDPARLIAKLVSHATTLGLPQASNAALALRDKKPGEKRTEKKGNCDVCNSHVCIGLKFGGGPANCICMGQSDKNIPKSASDAETRYIKKCRAYVAKVKPTTLKSVLYSTICAASAPPKQATPVVPGAPVADGTRATAPTGDRAANLTGSQQATVVMAPDNRESFDVWWAHRYPGLPGRQTGMMLAKRPRTEAAAGSDSGSGGAEPEQVVTPVPTYAEGSDGLSAEVHAELVTRTSLIDGLLATCRRVAAHVNHLPGNAPALFQVLSDEDARCCVQFDAQATPSECALISVDGTAILFEDTAMLATAIVAGHRALVALNDIDRCLTNPLRNTRVVREGHPASSEVTVVSLTSAVELHDPIVSGQQRYTAAQLAALDALKDACRSVALAAYSMEASQGSDALTVLGSALAAECVHLPFEARTDSEFCVFCTGDGEAVGLDERSLMLGLMTAGHQGIAMIHRMNECVQSNDPTRALHISRVGELSTDEGNASSELSLVRVTFEASTDPPMVGELEPFTGYAHHWIARQPMAEPAVFRVRGVAGEYHETVHSYGHLLRLVSSGRWTCCTLEASTEPPILGELEPGSGYAHQRIARQPMSEPVVFLVRGVAGEYLETVHSYGHLLRLVSSGRWASSTEGPLAGVRKDSARAPASADGYGPRDNNRTAGGRALQTSSGASNSSSLPERPCDGARLTAAGERTRLLRMAAELQPEPEAGAPGPRNNNRSADGYAMGCYEPLPSQPSSFAPARDRAPCDHCQAMHDRDDYICPAEVGLPMQPPELEGMGTCGLSKHEYSRCSCARQDYDYLWSLRANVLRRRRRAATTDHGRPVVMVHDGGAPSDSVPFEPVPASASNSAETAIDHDEAQAEASDDPADEPAALTELRQSNETLIQALRDSSAELVAVRAEVERLSSAARRNGLLAPPSRVVPGSLPPGYASTPATRLPCGGSPLRAANSGSLGSLMSALHAKRLTAQRQQAEVGTGRGLFDLNDSPHSCATVSGGSAGASRPDRSSGCGTAKGTRGTTPKSPADAVLEAAEHMATAQAGQFKLIRNLHGEVNRLRGRGLVAGASSALQALTGATASSLRHVMGALSWLEIWAVLMTAGWLGPRVLPALCSRLKALLVRQLARGGGYLMFALKGDRADAAAQAIRLTIVTWLLRLLGAVRGSTLAPHRAMNGPHDGGAPVPAAAEPDANAVLAAAMMGHPVPRRPAARLASIREQAVCAPLPAKRGHVTDLADWRGHAALFSAGTDQREAALCDSGATVDCCLNDIGRIPDSFVPDPIDMAVGDSEGSLNSPGSWLHALTRVGADGTEEDGLFRMYYTPSGIAHIFSEPLEVNERKSSIEWAPERPRVVTTATGTRLELKMAHNGLGWLQIRPITDPERLRALVCASGLAARPAAFGVISSDRAMVLAPEAAVRQPALLRQSPHSSVGMSRAPKLTGLELLKRFHVVLGHPSLPTLLATLADASDVDTSVITKADIESFVRAGCGVCESAKMKRPAFPRVADRTPKPVGKYWTFDSLHLRVPAAQFKYKYITRFVNEVVDADGVAQPGMRRSYGHLALTSADIEAQCQRLRAWVRPVHGEIEIMKHDSLPAQESRSMQDYMIDSGLHDRSSAPYCHEGVGSVEITWLHDVPSANAQLFACGDGEEHFYTSFLDVEAAGADLCGPNRPSRASVYYGAGRNCRISHRLAYGAPVKFLTHPEVRDSKFDEHSTPGIYRGPSRDDESAHRCWVSVGTGAAIRHTTVDVGCMRIDERGVLARCERSHESHQPHSQLPQPPTPAADHSRWLNPAQQSYSLLDVWSVNTPMPASPFVLILGAGEPRDGDICSQIAERSQKQLLTVPIDKCRGGYEQDWCIPAVRERLCCLAAHDLCVLVIYMFDCSGWTVLRCKRPGPEPLFDADHLNGITDANGDVLQGAVIAREAVDAGVTILRAAHTAGKATLGESPVGRGKGSPFAFKAAGYDKHVSAWTYPPLAAELEQHAAVAVYADQGAAGAATQKTTQFMAVGDAVLPARSLLGSLQLQKRLDGADSLVGAETGDYSRASAARQYPKELCDRIARLAVAVRDAGADRGVLQRPGGAAGADAKPDDASEPASVRRPRRAASDVRYDKDGRLVAVAFEAPRCVSDETGCPLLAQAAVVALGRQCYDAAVTGSARASLLADSATQASTVPTLVTVRVPLFDVAAHDLVQSSAMFAVLPGGDTVPLPAELDVANALAWHEPHHYGEYRKSPQRALWRTAMELKMVEYRSLMMFELVPASQVRAAGHKVMRTVWAFKIKFDKDGIFQKLNPRWCVVGTEMSRDIYESHADTVRWTTILVLMAIRAHYNVLDFQFDISNAFQATRTDCPDSEHLPELYYEQAKDFEETGANGEKLVCRALTAHQGRIDSARLFSTKFGQTLLKRAGCRRALWDPQLWCFHNGALAGSDASLDKVLAAAAGMPAVSGAPQGWAVFGLHVDDGIGLVSSNAVQAYLVMQISAEWEIKASRWQKVLGYTIAVDDDAGTVSVSCLPSLQAAAALHAQAAPTFQPKHPYSMGIQSVGPGIKPPDGSPELADFQHMQTNCRKGLGLGIWQQRAHPKLTYPINYLCGYMSNPSAEVYKHYKHTLLHELAYPGPLVFGGSGKRSLVCDTAPVAPFASGSYEYGLHVFVDANLGTPPAEASAIADGSSKVHPSCHGKSFTGMVAMLGGAPIESLSQRQHLHAPDAYTSEVSAAGTAVHRTMALRGLLDELRIVQDGPTVIYCDSASAIFVAEDSASIRRSVWIHRRAAVLREAVDMGDVKFVKIHEKDNCADGFTKPIKAATLAHHLSHILPHFSYVRVA